MSFSETIFLFFLALIIFGPKKLPEIARQVGKVLNEFRRASNEFKAQIEQEISNLEVEKKEAEKRSAILPPSSAPEGTANRTLNSDPVKASEAPATPAASPEQSVSSAQNETHTEGANQSAPASKSVNPPSDSAARSAAAPTPASPSSSSSTSAPATASSLAQESHA